MRILRSVVAPSAAFMAYCDSKITGRGGIRSQIICDELVWDKAIFFSSLRINLSAARLFLLVWTRTSSIPSASTARQRWTERPAPHALIGHQDPALGKQILDVAETQGEPDIKPDRLLDDFRREAVAAIADLSHHRWLRLKVTDGKPNGDVMVWTPPTQRHRGAIAWSS